VADEAPSVWDVDGGRAARSYANCPYLHHTAEIYPLFGDLLAPLGDGIRVLDIARERLDALGVEGQCFPRSFNRPGWHEGLGQFDAVVSTLALFHLAQDGVRRAGWPERTSLRNP